MGLASSSCKFPPFRPDRFPGLSFDKERAPTPLSSFLSAFLSAVATKTSLLVFQPRSLRPPSLGTSVDNSCSFSEELNPCGAPLFSDIALETLPFRGVMTF